MSDVKLKSQLILAASAVVIFLCMACLSSADLQIGRSLTLLIGIVSLLFLLWAWSEIKDLNLILESEKELLGLTLASIGYGAILCDKSGRVSFMNKEAERLTGWKNKEAQKLKLHSVYKIVDKENRQKLTCLTNEECCLIGPTNNCILLSRTDQEIDICQSITSIAQNDGSAAGMLLIFKDLIAKKDSTDHKQTEAALLRTTELLERTGEMAQVGGWQLDLRSMELFWSLQTCRIHDLEQLVTPTLEQAINFYAPEARPIIRAAVQEGIDHGTPWDLELPMTTAKGREILVRAQGSVIKENDKVVKLLGVFQDITERKKIEEDRLKMELKLQQAHKLESIGLLAGGIAHDFNNILTGLFGYIEIARLHAGRGNLAMIESSLKSATDSFNRAKDLTKQLLTFSRGGAPLRRQHDIKVLIRTAATFALSGSSTRLEINIPEDLWPSYVDENQISQVIDNIVRNAREAMAADGTISIKAENLLISSDSTQSLPAGRYSRITIKDYGPGVPEENLAHIFDPFFSTKGAGRGLGLSLAYSIIKKHEGMIEVDSKSGQGASFIIYLPASCELASPEINSEPAVTIQGMSKILIMDDEKSILNYTSEALKDFGYIVESAFAGEKALELYKQAKISSQQFNLVILDLTVRGGMGGVETLRELLKIDPEVKAIVSSGYSDDPILINPQAYGFKGIIQKPYKIKEMLKIIESVANNQSEKSIAA